MDKYERTLCNIGYIGEGKHKARINHKLIKKYNSWSNMINRCYKCKNISVNENDILNWCNHPTYNNRLWFKIEEYESMIASGIAEYDEEKNEGILEWIQVCLNIEIKDMENL